MNKQLAETAVYVAVTMILAPLVAGCGPSLPPDVQALNVISAEDFNGISDGDSYDQVTETLGAAGTIVTSRSPLGGVSIPRSVERALSEDGTLYAWRNSAGDVFLVGIEEGEVVAMAEVPRTTE